MTAHFPRSQAPNSERMEEAPDFRLTLLPSCRRSTAIPTVVGPGSLPARYASPFRVIHPHRCDMGWIRRLDLRLAVGDPDGGPGDRGGDVRSCRPECGGECRVHAPYEAKLRWHNRTHVA